MTNSYCQPSSSPYWFPVAPGIENLPPLPEETINETSLPANGVLAPEEFDPNNVDLCELFDTILPTDVPPVYAVEVSPDTVIVPYQEIIKYEFRVRSYLNLKVINYALGSQVALTLAVRVNSDVIASPVTAELEVRLSLSAESESIDYVQVQVIIRLGADAEFTPVPYVLYHLNGRPGDVAGTFENKGTSTQAVVTSQGELIYVDNDAFRGTSVYCAGAPSRFIVTDPGMAATANGGFTLTFRVWLEPLSNTTRTYGIWSPAGLNNTYRDGLSIYPPNYQLTVHANGSQYASYWPYGTNLHRRWLDVIIQKEVGSYYWHFYIDGIADSVYISPGSYPKWYDTAGQHIFGAFSVPTGLTDYHLTGAISEIAYFPGIAWPLVYGDDPIVARTSQYSPESLDTTIRVKVLLTVSAEFMFTEIIREGVVIAIKINIERARTAFVKVVSYTGNGSSLNVNTPGLTPSFVMSKSISGNDVRFFDSIRGTSRSNQFHTSGADSTGTILTSFNSEGLTLNSSSVLNGSGSPYILMAFGNTDPSYVDSSGTVPVTISKNKDFGFSILQYTGISLTGSASSPNKIPHGLNSPPDVVLIKANSYNYYPALAGAAYGTNLIDFEFGYSGTVSASMSISFPSNGYIQGYGSLFRDCVFPSAQVMIYAFTSVPGKTKIGNYGGYANNPKFIPLDFKPSLVIIKQITLNNSPYRGEIFAYSRDLQKSWRFANYGTDATYSTDIQLSVNGFSFPANSPWNQTGERYLYMAFRDVLAEIEMPSFNYDSQVSGTVGFVKNSILNAACGQYLVTSSALTDFSIYYYALQGEPYAGISGYQDATLIEFPQIVNSDFYSYGLALQDAALTYEPNQIDPYFEYVTLLLHMNGANLSTSFIDNSLYDLIPTVSGNAQISTTQSKFGGASGLFDGNGDFLTIPATATGNINGDFTAEAYVRLNAMPTSDSASSSWSGWFFIVGQGTPSTADGWGLLIGATKLGFQSADSLIASGNHGMAINTWYHIAVSRNTGTLRLFVDGISVASVSNNSSLGAGSNCYIGSETGQGAYFNGYMDEVRITRQARYTATFTPPVPVIDQPAELNDPFYSYVDLMLRLNGADNGTTFIDNGPNERTVTRNGDAKTSYSKFRYGGSSAYFNGAGDYLTAASQNLNGNWTVECWVYPTIASQQTIISFNNGGSSGINIWMNSSRQIVVDNGVNAQSAFTGGALALNNWSHLAIVRSNGTTTAYIDGSSVGSNTFTPNTVNSISIGRYNLSPFYYFTGYIDDIRVTNLVARYPGNFRPIGPHSPWHSTRLIDPYLSSVSLLLSMAGQNNTTAFIDRSTSFLQAIDFYGARISSAQSKFGGTSALFDGVDDYIDVTTSTSRYSFSGDFTVEFWTYRDATQSTYPSILEFGTYQDGILLRPSAGSDHVYINNVNIGALSGIVASQWQHFAITRSGTAVYIFIDGISRMATSVSGTINSSGALRIGASRYTTGQHYKGYIDEFKVIKGHAVYTTGFITPTHANDDVNINDPYFSAVSLLMHMNGANGSASFIDSSTNKFNPVPNGNVQISTAQSVFSGSSAYFDGNGDNISIGDNGALEIGNADFTLECWINVTSLKGYQAIASKSHTASDLNGWVLTFETNNSLAFYAGNGSWSVSLNGGAIISANAWYHIAVSRNGSTWRMFVNGFQVATATSSIAISDGTLPLYIGRYPYFPSANSTQDFGGYIDELRFTKNICRYTSNFVPRTVPFYDTDTSSLADPYFSNVSLLLHMNGTNASTTFTDSSSNACVVTRYGNAQISTTQMRLGTASAYFDGTGDGLTIPSSSNFDFGAGDFTIELWAYATVLSGASRGLLNKGWGASVGSWLIYYDNSSSKYSFYASSNGSSWDIASNVTILSSPSINRWYHIAVTRTGTLFRTFVDGIQTNNFTSSASIFVNASQNVSVGADATGTGSSFAGYIDEVRVTKGISRYTSNFYVRGTAFPDNS